MLFDIKSKATREVRTSLKMFKPIIKTQFKQIDQKVNTVRCHRYRKRMVGYRKNKLILCIWSSVQIISETDPQNFGKCTETCQIEVTTNEECKPMYSTSLEANLTELRTTMNKYMQNWTQLKTYPVIRVKCHPHMSTRVVWLPKRAAMQEVSPSAPT